jgi:hypothetical protein
MEPTIASRRANPPSGAQATPSSGKYRHEQPIGNFDIQ